MIHSDSRLNAYARRAEKPDVHATSGLARTQALNNHHRTKAEKEQIAKAKKKCKNSKG